MEIKINEQDSLFLEEYNGKYSITPMRNGYKQWAKYRKNKDEYQEKDWPVKVILGSREEAIKACQEVIKALGAGDVPF